MFFYLIILPYNSYFSKYLCTIFFFKFIFIHSSNYFKLSLITLFVTYLNFFYIIFLNYSVLTFVLHEVYFYFIFIIIICCIFIYFNLFIIVMYLIFILSNYFSCFFNYLKIFLYFLGNPIRIHAHRSELTSRSFVACSARLRNSLPFHIRSSSSQSTFNRLLRAHLLGGGGGAGC